MQNALPEHLSLSLWGQEPVKCKTFTEMELAYHGIAATVQKETCLEVRGHGFKFKHGMSPLLTAFADWNPHTLK